jgi:N-acetylneuraminic acid mutarotase
MPRSSHAAIVYENRFLVVLGGEGLGTVKGDQTSVLLNDIWVYDVMENVWSEVAATNKNFFKPRSCFTANLYKNKVFVFGGIVSLNSFRPSDEFCVLSLI